MSGEVGRELKVSELVPRTIVVLKKETNPVFCTVWVVKVWADCVVFFAGELKTDFFAKRTGPGLERITDDSGIPMQIFEYLGAE
jgi:hypothetical protein